MQPVSTSPLLRSSHPEPDWDWEIAKQGRRHALPLEALERHGCQGSPIVFARLRSLLNNWLAGESLSATVLLVFLLAGCDCLNAVLGTFVEECRGFLTSVEMQDNFHSGWR